MQDRDEYRYHISPRSLDRARRQGLKVEQLLALLARHADAGIPTAVTKAVTRWEARGLEARAEMQAVLRVSRPEILKQLRESKAARFLGESLGPTAVIIKHGAESRVIAALAELGILAEDSTCSDQRSGGQRGVRTRRDTTHAQRQREAGLQEMTPAFEERRYNEMGMMDGPWRRQICPNSIG